MSIIDEKNRRFSDLGDVNSMATMGRTIRVLSKDNEFVEEVLGNFLITEEDYHEVIPIGNLKNLLDDIEENDSQILKFDAQIYLRNVYPEKYLEDGAAVFDILGIKDPRILKDVEADHLKVETCYSAKTDFFEFFKMGKFANSLIEKKKDYLIRMNMDDLRKDNSDRVSARLIKMVDGGDYFLRAITSETMYKNYGINFSLLVAILALRNYVKRSGENVYVSSYQVDDSRISASFSLAKKVPVSDCMDLSFNLILRNDEIKQSSVSMNGAFRLTYRENERETSLEMVPSSYKGLNKTYQADMLTYSHSMNVRTVYEKISCLSHIMDEYVKQVSILAPQIVEKKNPAEIKNYVIDKVNAAKQDYFLKYKSDVVKKLVAIDVKTVFDLFEALRSVEELFGDDIQSRVYWQKKLFDILVYGV